MKNTVASLFALLSIVAFAAEQKSNWFDMDIKDIPSDSRNWPTDGADYRATYCTTTNTAAGSFDSKRIAIEAEQPMAVTADGPAAVNDATYAEIKATMKMVPFASSALPEVPEEAKTAVIAVDSGGVTNFWVAAGVEELQWVDTGIAADVTRDTEVVIVASNGVDSTCTEWKFDDVSFITNIVKTSSLHGVSFLGQGELTECCGNIWDMGLNYFFRLAGIPSDISVVVVNAEGEVISPGKYKDNELIGYTYTKDAVLGLSYIAPDGWPFWDGTYNWTDVYTNNVDGNVFTPFGGWGISPLDYGPIDGWCVVAGDSAGDTEFLGRYASTADALSAMKDHCGLIQYYSESGHTIEFAQDGSAITIDGMKKQAGERYHYFDDDGVPMLLINDGEADITSVAEDAEDADYMSIGSILNTFSGFDYSVLYSDDLRFETGLGMTEAVRGNGGKLELKAPKGDKGKRFYKINITDRISEE